MIQVQVDTDVFEDSFEEGEGEYVSAWTDVVEFYDMTPKEAVEKMFSDNIVYNLNWKDIGTDEDDTSMFHYSVMVDVDNCEASQGEIDSWKEGTTKLYAARMRVTVTEYEPIPTDMENIRRGVVKDSITSKMIADEQDVVFNELYTVQDIVKGNTVEMHQEARKIAIERLENR